jgi:hypothetical protein
VLCVDENSQIQALERTQPMLPMGARLHRRRHPRLPAPRHNHAVRCPQRARQRGHRPMQTPPWSSGVPGLPAAHRSQCTGPSSTSTLSSTTTPLTSIPKSERGSRVGRVGTFTSPLPMPPGSIRLSASSPSSLNALSVGALSTPPLTSSKKSIASFDPQCKFEALRVDCYCRLHPSETRATLSANFRDRITSCRPSGAILKKSRPTLRKNRREVPSSRSTARWLCALHFLLY